MSIATFETLKSGKLQIAAILLALTNPLYCEIAQAAEPVHVRYVSAFPVMSLVVANQTSIPNYLGYYQEEGVAVDYAISAAGGSMGAAQLVASGRQDVASASVEPMLNIAAQGKDLGLAAFYNQLRDFHNAFAVAADSPYKTMQDLKGQLIGVSTLAGGGDLTAKYLAREAGMDPDASFKFAGVGVGAQALHALNSKQVAALVMTRSSFAQMETIGGKFRYIELPSSARGIFGPGLYARRDYIQNNRKTLVGVGRAVAKSTLFMITNPEAAVRIHWKLHPEQIPQGIPFDKALSNAIQVLKVQIIGLSFGDDEKVKKLGYYSPESWKAYIDYLNIADRVKDATPYYTNDLIDEINDFDHDKVIAQANAFKMPQ